MFVFQILIFITSIRYGITLHIDLKINKMYPLMVNFIKRKYYET